MKKFNFITKILFLTAVLLGITRIVVSNVISTSGVALSETNSQIGRLRLENSILSEKLLSASSLTTVASEAASLGFQTSSNKYVLSLPASLAVSQ